MNLVNTKPAYKLQPGDTLGHISHDRPNEARVVGATTIPTDPTCIELIVTDADTSSPGHYEATRIIAKWDEVVVLPRRDGPPKNWTDGPPPKSNEVYPGDILPTEGGATQPADELQRVIDISIKTEGAARFPFVYIRTTNPGWESAKTTVLYKFAFGQPVVFPHPRTNLTNRTKQPIGELVFFGPYQHRITGARFEFARHPFGRGRWPSHVAVYDPQLPALPNDAAHRCRFPQFDWDPDLVPLAEGLPVGRVKAYTRRSTEGWTL